MSVKQHSFKVCRSFKPFFYLSLKPTSTVCRPLRGVCPLKRGRRMKAKDCSLRFWWYPGLWRAAVNYLCLLLRNVVVRVLERRAARKRVSEGGLIIVLPWKLSQVLQQVQCWWWLGKHFWLLLNDIGFYFKFSAIIKKGENISFVT